MRLVCVGCLALSALAQINLPSGFPPTPRPAPQVNHPYRGGYGYWGGGYWGGGAWGAPRNEVRPALPPPEPKAPILASSSLYQADRANPVMREYGALPAPSRVALVALTDGSVQAVWAYWLEGDQLAFVTVGDASHKVPISRLDRDRTEKLNRQQGVDFHLAKP